jgi:hypothetical protein
MQPTTAADILRALSEFAEDRPGIRSQDYGYGPDAWRTYRRDAATATRDLRRVRSLLVRAYDRIPPLTVDDLLSAARGSRLSIDLTPDGVTLDYCPGQYYPTEYRAEVARVLNRALSRLT